MASYQNEAILLENQLKDFFDHYDINSNEAVAIKNVNALTAALKVPCIKSRKVANEIAQSIESINAALLQFHPRHIAYYKAKLNLEQSIDDQRYNRELRNKGAALLSHVIDYRKIYLTNIKDAKEEKTFTDLFTYMKQGIEEPTATDSIKHLYDIFP